MNSHSKSLSGLLATFSLLTLGTALFSLLVGPVPQAAQASIAPPSGPAVTLAPTTAGRSTPMPTPMPGPYGVWAIVSSPNTGSPQNYLYGVGGAASNDMWAVGEYGIQQGITDWQVIEHWNGTNWTLAASPAITTPNELLAVSAIATNDVWAVGGYDSGGQSLIEHWDGLNWNIVANPNPGLSNRFFGVAAVSSNNVWAVGYYLQDGNSLPRTLVEHWNGGSWNIVPSPNLGVLSNQLNSVTTVPNSPNELWAVGVAGSSTLTLHWDGTQWSIVSSPNPGVNPQLDSVAANGAADVWAVGYTGGNSGPLTLTEHWNGSTWSVVPSPNPSGTFNHLLGVTSIAANNVWAVGDFGTNPPQTLILQWNGTNWVQVPGDNSGPNGLSFSLTAVHAITANEIWSVGSNSHTLAERSNGTSWTQISTPNVGIGQNTLNGVSASASNDIWEVGYYTFGAEERTLIEHWNGTSWIIAPSPNTGKKNNVLNGIVAVSSSDVWAVGSADSGNVPDQITLILHWDGTHWSIVPSPSPGAQVNSLAGVAADSANDVWVVGYSSMSIGSASTLTERWDGSTWSVVPSPNVSGFNDQLNGVAALGTNNVWAVGYSGYGDTLTEHWDGASWIVVPSPDVGGESDVLYAVSGTSASDVWAVGESSAGFIYYYTLAEHWDGSAWSIVPSVNNSDYSHLRGVAALSPDDVWAVGTDSTYPMIERWNGSTWSLFPSPEPTGGGFLFAATAITSCDVWAAGQTAVTNIGIQTLDEHFTPLTQQPTNTPIPTNTPQPTSTPTYTNTPEPTQTVGGPSATPIPTNTATVPTNTPTIVPTEPLTASPTQQATSTHIPTPTQGAPTITITNTSIPSTTPTTCALTFIDVPQGSTFYPYIHCLACLGIINGYPDNTFRPNNNVTRGQLSKIISNAAGLNDPQTVRLFEDVSVGSTFFDYVGRLASRGYIGGYPCGGPGEPCDPGNLPYFRPNKNATRGQISKIVSNAAGYQDPSGDQIFEDVPPSSAFYVFVQRLASRGVMAGYACGGVGEPCNPPANRGYFRPSNNATRGQTSKIVRNTFFPDCQISLISP